MKAALSVGLSLTLTGLWSLWQFSPPFAIVCLPLAICFGTALALMLSEPHA
jgi:hypothetical protein